MSTNSVSKQIVVVAVMLIGAWMLSACSGVANAPASLVNFAGQGLNYVSDVQTTNVSVISTPAANQSGCFDGGCHASLKAGLKQYVHTPFEQEQCLACHTADHKDAAFTPERTLELCYSCHTPKSLGKSHPMGPGVIDPRTGQMLTCLSCHGYHSADNPNVMLLDGRGELCVSCHTEFIHPIAQP